MCNCIRGRNAGVGSFVPNRADAPARRRISGLLVVQRGAMTIASFCRRMALPCLSHGPPGGLDPRNMLRVVSSHIPAEEYWVWSNAGVPANGRGFSERVARFIATQPRYAKCKYHGRPWATAQAMLRGRRLVRGLREKLSTSNGRSHGTDAENPR